MHTHIGKHIVPFFGTNSASPLKSFGVKIIITTCTWINSTNIILSLDAMSANGLDLNTRGH